VRLCTRRSPRSHPATGTKQALPKLAHSRPWGLTVSLANQRPGPWPATTRTRDSGKSSPWQAFKRPYETTHHRGIVAGLAIFKRCIDCSGTIWTSNSARDPVAFFRTVDMADTGYCGFFPAAVALSHTLAPGNRHVPWRLGRCGTISDKPSTTLTSTCIRPVGVVDLLVFLVLGDGSYRYV
jgi:hypothetical protein